VKSVTDAVMEAIGAHEPFSTREWSDLAGPVAAKTSGPVIQMKAAERQLRIRQMFESKDFLDLEDALPRVGCV